MAARQKHDVSENSVPPLFQNKQTRLELTSDLFINIQVCAKRAQTSDLHAFKYTDMDWSTKETRHVLWLPSATLVKE